MVNGYFMVISGHFSANCMFTFHKTEIQKVILMCSIGLKSDWFLGYDTKFKYVFPFLLCCNFVQKHAFEFYAFLCFVS